jgi:hypothetical protein
MACFLTGHLSCFDFCYFCREAAAHPLFSQTLFFGKTLMFVLLNRNYYISDPRNHQVATFEKTNFGPQLGCANLQRTAGAS